MNLELLKTFLEVERCRHFGRAAEELHLTQAAVSARIRQLEETLGVRLFERKRRDIQLTPPGPPAASAMPMCCWPTGARRARTSASAARRSRLPSAAASGFGKHSCRTGC